MQMFDLYFLMVLNREQGVTNADCPNDWNK